MKIVIPNSFHVRKVRRLAEILERDRDTFAGLISYEAGKVVQDADDEVREAINFCHYYANEAKKLYPHDHSTVTGESSITTYEPRGEWLCISPWNFPLAILVGQAVAALAVGNHVTLQASPKCTLVATRAHEAMLEALLPVTLTFSPVMDKSRYNGVSFTGSHETAKLIQEGLAQLPGEILPFIAETSGVNCVVVDSSVVLEQAVVDVASSAFNSNGQRCSSAGQLIVNEFIAEEFIQMLRDHLKTWTWSPKGEWQRTFSNDYYGDNYHLDEGLQGTEVFGPHLAYVTYHDTNDIVRIVNDTGYGLTLGIHSRVASFVQEVSDRCRVGNIYVNRNQIGAVVGSQPFGGCGMSGTGPKAGGVDYLKRFVYEKTVTTNLSAMGGNSELLSE